MKIVSFDNDCPGLPIEKRYVRCVMVHRGSLIILSSNSRNDAELFEESLANLLVTYMRDSGYLLPHAEVS